MNEIVRENRGVTADTALRLARYFGTSERFWLNLQTEYELRRAQITKAAQVAREVRPRAA
jgi:addiction module HigA family antidote